MGFPDWYDIELIGLSGATVQAFEAWAARIVALQPELIIVDIGRNDMVNPNVICVEVAADLFLHLVKILDRILPYRRPRVVLLEQHLASRVQISIMFGMSAVLMIGMLIWRLFISWIHGWSSNGCWA